MLGWGLLQLLGGSGGGSFGGGHVVPAPWCIRDVLHHLLRLEIPVEADLAVVATDAAGLATAPLHSMTIAKHNPTPIVSLAAEMRVTRVSWQRSRETREKTMWEKGQCV